uniref:Large ribosomal subunit protein bL33c n=1 Tax=Burmannia itoana TaxID=396654 RepID=A0A5B9TDR7_9LILI|nr:ribosomal protein L33 [Burmannia itoana]
MSKGKDVRIIVILECTNCSRNYINNKSSRYITQKNRHNTSNLLELRKFCCYCHKHTIHKEIS